MRSRQKGILSFWKVLMEFIFLVLSMGILAGFVHNFYQPDTQIAFANVELLKLSIDKVCASNAYNSLQNALEIDFNLPQPKPISVGGLLPELARLLIKQTGDPHFVLYYEMFPPGKAVGWEVYHELQPRLLMNILASNNLADRALFLLAYPGNLQLYTRFGQVNGIIKRSAGFEGHQVIFSNVILDDQLEENEELNLVGSAGEWHGDFYQFTNYAFLPRPEKTAIKYRACGEGKLCFKTREGVLAMPLEACQQKGIKIDTIKFSPQSAQLLEDFSLVSPCRATLKIYRASGPDCACLEGIGVKTNLYQISDKNLNAVGDHYSCVRNFENYQSAPKENPSSCIIMHIDNVKEGYCTFNLGGYTGFEEWQPRYGAVNLPGKSFELKAAGELSRWKNAVEKVFKKVLGIQVMWP